MSIQGFNQNGYNRYRLKLIGKRNEDNGSNMSLKKALLILMPKLCFYFVKLFFPIEVLLLTYDILIVHKFLSQNILLRDKLIIFKEISQ